MRKNLYLFLVFFCFVLVCAQEKVNPENIIQMSIEAQGGREALEKVRESYVVTEFKVYSPSGELLGESKTYTRHEPMKFRREDSILGMVVITGYDGEKAWIQRGEMAIEAPRTVLDSIKASERRGNLLLKYIDKGCKLEYLGISNIEGKDCYGIKFTDIEGLETSVFFDNETYLPIKTEYSAPNEFGKVVKYEYFSYDFRTVEGTKVPFRSVVYGDGKKIIESMIKEIKFNPGLDDKIFSMPEKK